MKFRQSRTSALICAGVAAVLYGASGSGASAQLRFPGVYQEGRQASCTDTGPEPCTVEFSTLTKAPLKVLKASCTILSTEGGSPSKEITGVTLGRVTENGKNFVAGQYLAPLQTEFAGPGQIVINVLADTLFVVPRNFRPAIRVSRLNGPPVSASCTIAGEELKD
ncbi:hypothetical protein IHQ68_01765 [Chelatococcus sambhunathii]|uniref:Secreted protein n=1 Tax=Chelatococcus sambhunathii TaxID=363953 RepID=A0ABU1DB64_9HYPH|nr:hypothetical protein [Chelatococcus sambhunathii]MDR4305349.1 hypothetical protein [Chelatococcus sambhunathii]